MSVPESKHVPSGMVRCETCLGMGYKGRWERGQWKIRTCRQCQGTGSRHVHERQRPRTTTTTTTTNEEPRT